MDFVLPGNYLAFDLSGVRAQLAGLPFLAHHAVLLYFMDYQYLQLPVPAFMANSELVASVSLLKVVDFLGK